MSATAPEQERLPFSPQRFLAKQGGLRRLQVVGLFSGIGGLELGISRSCHQTQLLCEVDPGARAVLEARFDVPVAEDIRELENLPSGAELLAAGFPCQDLSQAGRTQGISGKNSGLVEHVFRLLDRRPVPWVLLENVPFMLQLQKGRALEVLIREFELRGYHWAYRVVDARSFGLPQRRQRVIFLASNEESPLPYLLAEDAGERPLEKDQDGAAFGFYWTEGIRGLGWAVDAVPTLKGGSTIGVPSPPAIWMPDDQIVTPDIRDAERLQGFAAGWTEPAETVARKGHRWKLIGNAVSVPVAEWVGERLARKRGPESFEPKGAVRLQRSGSWPRVAWNVGLGEFTAPISAWPCQRSVIPLADFLQFEPKPLSARATAGFLSRAGRSRLRFRPDFLHALKAHLESVV